MPTRDPDLERFKTEINLTEYAAHCGYQLLRRETSRNSVAMRHPGTEHKIIIARGEDDHWIYFTIGNTKDSGSVIDFVMHRDGVSLGGARPILQGWAGVTAQNRPPREAYTANIEKSTPDRRAIIKQLCAMPSVRVHSYLASRAIGEALLTHPRFAGRVFTDGHGAAIFPHEDEKGICGYEIKNQGFTGFSPKGEKGLWRSNVTSADARLVLCESTIDAISYHALHPDPHTRYMSFGGGWSDKTRTLLHRAAEKHPGPEIILAYDNDQAGYQYETDTRGLLADAGKTITAHYSSHGKDWNEQLCTVRTLPSPKRQDSGTGHIR